MFLGLVEEKLKYPRYIRYNFVTFFNYTTKSDLVRAELSSTNVAAHFIIWLPTALVKMFSRSNDSVKTVKNCAAVSLAALLACL